MEADLLDGVGDVGWVNVRYWRAPTKQLNWVRLETGGPN
jgi:hypothetical protein